MPLTLRSIESSYSSISTLSVLLSVLLPMVVVVERLTCSFDCFEWLSVLGIRAAFLNGIDVEVVDDSVVVIDTVVADGPDSTGFKILMLETSMLSAIVVDNVVDGIMLVIL